MFQSLLTAPVQVIGAACAVCAAPSTVSPAIRAAAAAVFPVYRYGLLSAGGLNRSTQPRPTPIVSGGPGGDIRRG
jgi:hypothetical protein